MAVGQTVVIEELAHLRPRTYIVAFEDHAGLGDFIDARHQHCGVVVAYVRVALIVRDLCGAARRSFRRVTGSSSSAVWHSVEGRQWRRTMSRMFGGLSVAPALVLMSAAAKLAAAKRPAMAPVALLLVQLL
jgi:hypothetical protein